MFKGLCKFSIHLVLQNQNFEHKTEKLTLPSYMFPSITLHLFVMNLKNTDFKRVLEFLSRRDSLKYKWLVGHRKKLTWSLGSAREEGTQLY